MTIKAIIFDIGGVLEITPDLGLDNKWGQRLGLQPKEVIFVDDHKEVFASAQEMGMHCIEFKNNAQTIAEIEACIRSNI